MFKKYQHIERFGTEEVQQIELGTCYIFPKIDGTNGSIWLEDGKVQSGSRNRVLSLENDNAGFYGWVSCQERLMRFFDNYTSLRLYGEWLVPQSLRTYKQDSCGKFYVFDVMDGERYLSYEEYKAILEKYGIDYIPPISIITNPSYEHITDQLEKNTYLIQDGQGTGEGIVIKNYGFRNQYGRQTWAKIVNSEFKQKHMKIMGAPKMQGKKMIEEEIVEKYITQALCEKTLAKIKNEEGGWSSTMIPRLLSTVYYDFIREEIWEVLKEHKNPTINFRTLQHFVNDKVKEFLPIFF